jgi:cephalosporin hydroxylase
MKLLIDTDARTVSCETDGTKRTLDLYSKEAFEVISDQWLRVGWNQKYTYTFAWMGRPIIQLPADMVRMQEVLYRVKPDVIIETGVAHGGSLVYYASLCKAMEKGRVIGVDIEIRPHNAKAIRAHELSSLITLVEGNSVAQETVALVRKTIKPSEKVLVILDSNHTKEHVAQELEAYAGLVTSNSYVVATDGIMRNLDEVPRGKPDWKWNNPSAAAVEFAQHHPEFILEEPQWTFNESELSMNVTHWPGAWLRKK